MQSQSDTATAVGSEALSDAKSLSATAIDRVHTELDTRKSDAAAQVKSVSSAIGATADQLDPAAPQWLRAALEQGAKQVQTFAASIEQQDSRQLAASVGDFARRSPVTFLAACAAIGFGASRILKAGTTAATQSAYEPSFETDGRDQLSTYSVPPVSNMSLGGQAI